ncbi:MAG: hypothetical protein ACRD9R_19610 [Pyrinomonadaceae bacterium]
MDKVWPRLGTPEDSRECTRQVSLRQGNVYALPNGTELVVGVGREGRYYLYHPLVWAGKQWIVNMPIAYEVDASGFVLTPAGNQTCWRVEDLIDLNRSVQRHA